MATAQAACIERKHSNNESNGLKSPDKDFLCANWEKMHQGDDPATYEQHFSSLPATNPKLLPSF